MPDPGSPSSAATTPRGEGLPDLEGDSVDNACRAPSPDQIFDHQQQKLVLLLKQALRWLGTVIFIGFIIATLKIYEAKGNFPADQKVTFNTILTALSLGLGLNIFEAFKESAKILRWRILAERKHSEQEVDLILGMENLLSVMKLGWKSISIFNFKLRMILACMAWILLNLLAQTSVAAINLTYTVDDGTSYNDTYITYDQVNATKLACYFNETQGDCPGDVTRQAVAHVYGELSQSTRTCGPYTDITELQFSQYDPPYYCDRTPEKQEFAYRFKEYHPDDIQNIYPSFTNRTISVSSGPCFTYAQLSRTPTRDIIGDWAAWNYTYGNSTYNSTISIPRSSEGRSGTTYIYRGIRLPRDATLYSCGPRCIWMWAHKSPSRDEPSTFYECPITVGEVSNTTKDVHKIPDSLARVAAASIALQGRWAGTFENKIWTQYQFYPAGSRWEVHDRTTSEVGAYMAEFALGSLAMLAELNPRFQIPGSRPNLGSHLVMYNDWDSAIALFVCIVGVHLGLIVAVAWWTRLVVVPDDFNMVIGRLVRGSTAGKGNSKGNAKGNVELRVFENRAERDEEQTEREREREGQEEDRGLIDVEANHDGPGFVYGPRQLLGQGDSDFVLDIAEDVMTRKEWNYGRHPDGKYMWIVR